VAVDLTVAGGADAGGFLAAVLEGVEAEIGELGGLGVAVDGDDAAFFVKRIRVAKSGQ